ncbi:YdiU family protein [Cohnella sp. GCM10012308]|uniref:protein adenylyltransferase SelO n=1 Tax=Cohnella sp. GCM10012308 TaxID=3317329 RepID=UPI0036176743
MTHLDSTTTAGWRFDNSYARLPSFFYSRIPLNPVEAPKLAVLNARLAESLGLNEEALRSQAGLAVLSGSASPEGGELLAQAYAGHQFGHLTMLGDGRALLLGEHVAPDGQRLDIQLKGSGRTPYSRGGDGRAALGPMLREYVISEAMHGLGIPTTRSLAVVATGEPVFREDELPGAVLTRVAASHIRVGTFQYAAGAGGAEQVRELADYTMQRHYPEVDAGDYLSFLRAVVRRQASLIAKWQLVGFVHGVMNTDNMAISGQTIDYGPCAFLDAYDPSTVFSSIDAQGRYAYNQQPRIAAWNLARFAETLLPLLAEDEAQAVALAEREITAFPELFEAEWLAGMRAKLGLPGEAPDDETLIYDLLNLMEAHKADYTNTFASLSTGATQEGELFASEAYAGWYGRWRTRIGDTNDAAAVSQRLMKRSNPAAIARNHRVEEALEAAVGRGDYGDLDRLVEALRDPYAYTSAQTAYAALPDPSCGRYRTFCGT